MFNAVTKRRPDFVPIKIRRMAGHRKERERGRGETIDDLSEG